MAKKSIGKQFNVTARIVVIVETQITANDYTEALTKANEMGVSDFITVDAQHNDSSIRIASVGADGMWATDDY